MTKKRTQDSSAARAEKNKAGTISAHFPEESFRRTYAIPAREVAAFFRTDIREGLSEDESARRLTRHGPNSFGEASRYRLFAIFLRQLENPLALVLCVAGIAMFILGSRVDTVVIFSAFAITIAVGMVQEGRTSRAFEKLKASQETHAIVFREGKKKKILAQELVPGDVVYIEAGQSVPADMRLIEANNLLVDESALSGEWVPVEKDAADISSAKVRPLTEQTNMAWMGTLVVGGIGKGVVVATGRQTEMGKIAESLAEEDSRETPLQQSIKKLARFLAAAIVVIIAILTVFGVYRGESVFEMFLVAVAVAVAAVPEGLPAAVTVVLALGMEAILKKKGLVRNLLAAETLGSTTTILTDKTGTLTEARMSVAAVVTPEAIRAKRHFVTADDVPVLRTPDARDVLMYAILASDAFVESRTDGDIVEVRGRPVERAVIRAGLREGLSQEVLAAEYAQKDFLPFDSARRFAASLLKRRGEALYRMIVVGAPDVLLDAALPVDGASSRISEEDKNMLRMFQEESSAKGLRLVAVSYKDTDAKTLRGELKHIEKPRLEGLVFSGFIVMHDPLREGVAESVQEARRAGVRVVMLTGDHQSTARAVAEKAGIARPGEEVLTGSDIDGLSDAELFERLRRVNIIARVLPAQKLRIARVLKSRGEVVAMTGDGVNDAPALRSASIGVAIGSGTDVAKEASALVLLDDDFSVIVHAIEEGRRIIDNLKKIVSYLLSTGFSEIIVIAGALLFSLPLPFLPAQILWINIIEEGFMNFAFAFEPKERGLMERDPRQVGSAIMTPDVKKLVFILASVTGAMLIALYALLSRLSMPLSEIRTIMFIALAIDSLCFAFSLKNLHVPLWRINIFSNAYLFFALCVSVAALGAALLVPLVRDTLSLEPLSPRIVAFLVGLGFMNLFIIETVKFIVFGGRKGQHGV